MGRGTKIRRPVKALHYGKDGELQANLQETAPSSLSSRYVGCLFWELPVPGKGGLCFPWTQAPRGTPTFGDQRQLLPFW